MSDPLLEGFDAEFKRREEGPICALCTFSPLDERDLPPLGPITYRQAMRAKVRQFLCEARGKVFTADDGRNCRHFELKQRRDVQ